MCLFSKRLERGRFLWPSVADCTVTISSAQLNYLLDGRLAGTADDVATARREIAPDELCTAPRRLPGNRYPCFFL